MILPFLCPGSDSNRHTSRRQILSLLRLPISPPGLPGLQYYIIPFNFLHNYFFSPQILVNSQ